jgi:hypothetical protein
VDRGSEPRSKGRSGDPIRAVRDVEPALGTPLRSGVIVAVKPRPPFVRYFKTAERLNRQRKHRRGDKGGSDGRQTRDCHPIEIRE